MQPIVMAEMICAFALIVLFGGMLIYRHPSASSRLIKIYVVCGILWTLADAGTYIFKGPSYPQIMLWGIHFCAHTFGMVSLLVFIYYLKAVVEEKDKVNPWFFHVPAIILIGGIIGVSIDFFFGKIVTYQNGYMLEAGELPTWVLFLMVTFFAYLPVLAFLERKSVGRKTILILILYSLLPSCAMLLHYLEGGTNYTVVAGAMACFVVTQLLQSDHAWQKEIAFEKSLSYTIREQQKTLGVVSSLSDAYLCVYYIDLETEHFHEITPTTVEVISNRIGPEGNARQKFLEMSAYMVAPEYARATMDFTELTTLPARLADRKTIEFEFLGAHLGWCVAEFVAAARDENGVCTHVMWLIRSIQEKKELVLHEHALLLDMKLLLTALNTVYPRLNEVNLTQNTFKTFAIDRYMEEQLDGCTTFEQILHKASMMVPDDGQREQYLAYFQRENQIAAFERGEKTISYDHQQLGEDNKLHWMRTQVVFVEEQAEGIIQVSFAKNIDEEVAEEKKLKEAMEIARTASHAKSSFLFNMSHDIRTPMNAIIGFAELMGKHIGDEEKCKDYLGKIHSSSNFLLSLINNVLEVAKIESGKASLDETVITPGNISKEVDAVFEERMKLKNITYSSKSTFHSKYIYADAVKLKEIFLNLLSNAYKYTPEGGQVSVSYEEIPCEKEGYTAVKIVVADTGIGMSKEFLPHIFDEFSREKTYTEDKIEGTGLGMPIVKKMIDLMEGSIDVESELGKGTTFTLIIPHRLATMEETKVIEENKTDDIRFEGKRVLIAEDNELNAEIAIEIMQDFGFAVEHAEDGIICVDMLQKAPRGYYDLILMDIQMPNMDGYKATKVIREMEDDYCKNIPIVAMTANAFEEDGKNAIATGMNAHLSKPINVPKLIHTIAELLQ